MSIVADRAPRLDLPKSWGRLERAAEEAAHSLAYWRRRSGEAEEEIARLRRALDDLASERAPDGSAAEDVRPLRAENAALKSRIQQAHARVGMLLKRLAALGIEP